jgi:hypothetical protein
LLAHNEPHEEIARLEEHIEELYAKIESCRKFILASRIAVAGGGLALAAMLVGAIRFDLSFMAAAVAAVLGGIQSCRHTRSMQRLQDGHPRGLWRALSWAVPKGERRKRERVSEKHGCPKRRSRRGR